MAQAGTSRRDFLKQMGILSVAPLSFNISISFRHEPYWLRVLSRGIEYFQFDESSLDNLVDEPDKLRDIAYRKIGYDTWQLYTGIYSDPDEDTDGNMDLLVDGFKTGQFLLEHIDGRYTYSEDFPKVTYCSDPFRSIILFELSSIILDEINVRYNRHPIVDRFDLRLLHSSLGYSYETMATVRNALDIAPDNYLDALNTQLAKSCFNIAEAHLYIGDKERAELFYRQAEEFLPKGNDIGKVLFDNYLGLLKNPLQNLGKESR